MSESWTSGSPCKPEKLWLCFSFSIGRWYYRESEALISCICVVSESSLSSSAFIPSLWGNGAMHGGAVGLVIVEAAFFLVVNLAATAEVSETVGLFIAAGVSTTVDLLPTANVWVASGLSTKYLAWRSYALQTRQWSTSYQYASSAAVDFVLYRLVMQFGGCLTMLKQQNFPRQHRWTSVFMLLRRAVEFFDWDMVRSKHFVIKVWWQREQRWICLLICRCSGIGCCCHWF